MKKHLIILSASIAVFCACSSAPVIGVSSGCGKKDSVSENYIAAVRKAGGIPVILPRVGSEKEAADLLDIVDGVVFSGGEDFDPAYYGEDRLNESVEINAARDTSDILLIRTAIDAGKPVLGICRGMQGINIVLGGSLYQDIPAQIPGSEHRQNEPDHVASHSVILNGESVLSRILGNPDTLRVNSFHHQAVKDAAPGLKVTGYSPDGIAESMEGEGIMAVQFHPEAFIASGQDFYLPVFKELVRLSGGN